MSIQPTDLVFMNTMLKNQQLQDHIKMMQYSEICNSGANIITSINTFEKCITIEPYLDFRLIVVSRFLSART